MFRACFLAGVATVVMAGTAHADGWSIFVEREGGDQTPITVDGGEYVWELKTRLAPLVGIPASEQVLRMGGVVLSDDLRMVQLDLQNGTILTLDGGDGEGTAETISQMVKQAALAQLQMLVFTITNRVYNRVSITDRDGMYLASSGSDPVWSFWAESSLTDAIGAGGGIGLTFGADRGIAGGGVFGVFASVSTASGTDVRASAPALGLYLGLPLGRHVIVDGLLGVSQPRYDMDGTTFGDGRVTGSVGVAGRWEQDGLVMAPALRLSGFDETLPEQGDAEADRMSYRSLEASLRLESDMPFVGTEVTPYAEVGVARSVTESSQSGRDSGTERRAALGVQGMLGRGALSAEVSGRADMDGQDRAQVALRWTVGF